MLFCLFWQAVNQNQLAKHRADPKIEKLAILLKTFNAFGGKKEDFFPLMESLTDVGLQRNDV